MARNGRNQRNEEDESEEIGVRITDELNRQIEVETDWSAEFVTRVDAAALREHETISEFVSQCCRDRLENEKE